MDCRLADRQDSGSIVKERRAWGHGGTAISGVTRFSFPLLILEADVPCTCAGPQVRLSVPTKFIYNQVDLKRPQEWFPLYTGILKSFSLITTSPQVRSRDSGHLGGSFHFGSASGSRQDPRVLGSHSLLCDKPTSPMASLSVFYE